MTRMSDHLPYLSEHLEKCNIWLLETNHSFRYAKIFEKINGSGSLQREMARKVIGWVGCSPAPMTIFELEQALIIPAMPSDGSARTSSRLEPVELCGPVVEIVDEHVQFVHFTAREYVRPSSKHGFLDSLQRRYFFSQKKDSHIDRTESAFTLATTCITYLCRREHDLDLEDDEFVDGVTHGDYRLHYYAATFWPTLVEIYVSALAPEGRTQTQLRDLIDILDSLRTERQNTQFKESTTRKDFHALELLKKSSREVYGILCDAADLRSKSSSSLYRVDKGKCVRGGRALDAADCHPVTQIITNRNNG